MYANVKYSIIHNCQKVKQEKWPSLDDWLKCHIPIQWNTSQVQCYDKDEQANAQSQIHRVDQWLLGLGEGTWESLLPGYTFCLGDENILKIEVMMVQLM